MPSPPPVPPNTPTFTPAPSGGGDLEQLKLTPDVVKGHKVVDLVRQRLSATMKDQREIDTAVKELFIETTDGYKFQSASPYTSLLPEVMRAKVFPPADSLQKKVVVPTFDGTQNTELGLRVSECISISSGSNNSMDVILAPDKNGRLWAVKILHPEVGQGLAAGGALSCMLVEGGGLGAYGGCGRFPADYPDEKFRGAAYIMMAPIPIKCEVKTLPKVPDDLSFANIKAMQRLAILKLPPGVGMAVCHDGAKEKGGVLPFDLDVKGPEFTAICWFAEKNAGKEVRLIDIIDKRRSADDVIMPGIDIELSGKGEWVQP